MAVSLWEASCAKSCGAAPRISTMAKGPAAIKSGIKRAFGFIRSIGDLLARRVNNAKLVLSRQRFMGIFFDGGSGGPTLTSNNGLRGAGIHEYAVVETSSR